MINVTLGEVKPQTEKPFPKLMSDSKGHIYYFTMEKIGVPLNDPDYPSEISHSNLKSWGMQFFTDYNEPITLQNE